MSILVCLSVSSFTSLLQSLPSCCWLGCKRKSKVFFPFLRKTFDANNLPAHELGALSVLGNLWQSLEPGKVLKLTIIDSPEDKNTFPWRLSSWGSCSNSLAPSACAASRTCILPQVNAKYCIVALRCIEHTTVIFFKNLIEELVHVEVREGKGGAGKPLSGEESLSWKFIIHQKVSFNKQYETTIWTILMI